MVDTDYWVILELTMDGESLPIMVDNGDTPK